MTPRIKNLLRATASSIVLLSVAGCNSTIGQQIAQDWRDARAGFGQEWSKLRSELSRGTLFSDNYLKDENDVCAGERLAMADKGKFFDKQLVQAAAAGAVAGGLLALATDQNVVAGAAIGAGLGLAGGYLAKLQSEGLNGTQIASQARSDISAENKRIDELIASFDDLSDCRKREAAAIQAQFDSGSISRNDAEAQMSGVRNRFGEDRRKFQQIADQISDNSDNYAAVYNDIAADSGGQALQVNEYKAGQDSAEVSSQSAKKVAGTAEGSLTADSAQVEGLQEDCLTNVQKRDDCYDRVEMAAVEEEEISLDLG